MSHLERGHARTWLSEGQAGALATLAVILPQDPPSPRVPSPTVQAEGSLGQEEAITAIQSALRAHLARVRHR